MSELTIRIKKKTDGSAALSCTRADGSVTWQRQDGKLGGFFPLHDLTHYAVETVLGHRRGFYGLLVEGWDVTDFGAPEMRGKIPDDADWSERIVGFFDAERAMGGQHWPAEDLNEKLRKHAEDMGREPPAALTEQDLAAVRARRAELFAMWRAIPAGEALELPFNRGA